MVSEIQDLTVKSSDDSENERERLAAEADARIRRGAHWEDWRLVADGFVVGRDKAMRSAGTDRPFGPTYTKSFKAWMVERPWARETDSATRTHLFWVADHLDEIEAWRAAMTIGQRNALNHPSVVKRKFEASQRVTTKDPNAPKKETKLESLVRENEELWAIKKKLEHQIEKGDASLFDIKRDTVDAIADVVAGNVSIGRLDSLWKALKRKYDALKAAEKDRQAKAC